MKLIACMSGLFSLKVDKKTEIKLFISFIKPPDNTEYAILKSEKTKLLTLKSHTFR